MTPRWGEVRMWAAFFACLGLFVLAAWAGAARAGADPVDVYTVQNANRVCVVLDAFPDFDGIGGISDAIVNETGFSYYEAGGIIFDSVNVWCPRHLGLLQRFVDSNGPMVHA